MELGSISFSGDKIIAVVGPSLLRISTDAEKGDTNQNDSYFTLFLKFGLRLGAIYDRNAASHIKWPARF